MGRNYVETFDSDPGGWLGWDKNGAVSLEVKNSCIISRSPWWIDCNHCSPGAGFLHILFALHTNHSRIDPEPLIKVAGRNRFVDGNFPTDFTNAKITITLKGECALKGSQLLLLVQGYNGKIWINQVLSSQPIRVTEDWSTQSIVCVPDQKQWTNLGSRKDRMNFYGTGPIEELLKDINGDIILVLFPLNVVPLDPAVNPYEGWAEKDYQVDRTKLPSGYVTMDEVQIEFP
ncbi:MAG: hypothetical protein ACP5JO_08900 [Candidatus Ratteibacteria bacterium]